MSDDECQCEICQDKAKLGIDISRRYGVGLTYAELVTVMGRLRTSEAWEPLHPDDRRNCMTARHKMEKTLLNAGKWANRDQPK